MFQYTDLMLPISCGYLSITPKCGYFLQEGKSNNVHNG